MQASVNEGLNTKSSESGIGSPNGTLCNFVESITNSQWEIAVEKVMRSKSFRS